MRWERLFADLAAQEAAESLRQQETNIAEMTRLLASEGTLQERLLQCIGQQLNVHVTGRDRVQHLELSGVGKDWISGRENGREVLIQQRHVIAVEPGRHETPRQLTDERVLTIGFRSTLRELARQRVMVEVSTVSTELLLRGTIDQVGLDFLTLSQHDPDEFRRSKAVRAVGWVSLNQITQLCSWR